MIIRVNWHNKTALIYRNKRIGLFQIILIKFLTEISNINKFLVFLSPQSKTPLFQ